VNAPAYPKKKAVTATKHRRSKHRTTDKTVFYNREDLSSAGRIKTKAIEQVFSAIPEGTTDPASYVIKRNGRLFPTEKLTEELRSFIGIELAGDGSITDGVHINKIGFTQEVAFHASSQQPDRRVRPAVTTTQAPIAAHAPVAPRPVAPSGSSLQHDAHRKYFTGEDVRINSSADAVRLCREMLATEDAIDRDKEHFYVLHLNVRSRVTMIEIVSVGTLTSSVVHPRETFRRAIAQGSASIILAHNHPSGDADPSDEDKAVTKLMFEAGRVIGIDVLDHVVFSDSKAFSFRNNKNIE
jgi:DNA repair protein RadC